MTKLQPYLTDRSRVIDFQVCPRKRFYAYEYLGTGITPIYSAIPLTVGSAVHKGMEVMMTYAMSPFELLKRYLDPKDSRDVTILHRMQDDYQLVVDFAVDQALSNYDKDQLSRGFSLEPDEDPGYVYYEQRALIEALIRVWDLYRSSDFFARYKVINVEREEFIEFSDNVIFMSRPDVEVEHRETGARYIISWKTTSEWNKWREQEGSFDVQGLSELAAVEARYRKELHDTKEWHEGSTVKPTLRVAGIHMEYLVKGKRSRDKSTNTYVQDSFLVRPWRRTGITTSNDQYAWKYWFQDAFGNNRNLGKSFSRVNIWEEMSIKEWVEMLHRGEIQPEVGDPFAEVIKTPVPYQRNEEDVTNWIEQVAAQELRNEDRLSQMAPYSEHTAIYKGLHNEYFPQYRHSCMQYNSPCQFSPICFGDAHDNPMGSQLYQIRSANHDLEKERFLVQLEKEILTKPDPKGEKINGIRI